MVYQRMAYPYAHDVASLATNMIRCPRAEGPSIYIIITKNISSETEGPGASIMARTLQLRFREFGAPIIYMIPVPLLT